MVSKGEKDAIHLFFNPFILPPYMSVQRGDLKLTLILLVKESPKAI
uniref:Macaca fascicularis brain cDNA clone: QmoA-10195, similar to human similar to hypothetical protein (LOC389293), mRNA, RefSeq: XM_371741.2 n=1 Tax=Macaca fascicularis TaxID=9541 RepID=I7GJP3_MACFA|nr:unnamed protein product [Macaca fascicularis]